MTGTKRKPRGFNVVLTTFQRYGLATLSQGGGVVDVKGQERDMSDKTKQLSFVADEETIALINSLKRELRAPTTAAVFRKALAIAKVATEQGRESGVVTVKGRGQDQSDEVSIALRA